VEISELIRGVLRGGNCMYSYFARYFFIDKRKNICRYNWCREIARFLLTLF